MSVVQSYDDIIARLSADFGLSESFCTNHATFVDSGNIVQRWGRQAYIKALPGSLPTGVTAFVPTAITLSNSNSSSGNVLAAKLINLGSLDISGASGTFTDGSNMGTATELNTSGNNLYSGVIMEVTTALNSVPGSFTITYTDQDGHGTETNPTTALGASAPIGSGSILQLNSGDFGVRDITAAARTGGTTPTGVIKFWGIIPICFMTLSSSTIGPTKENLLTASFNFVKLGAGDVIGLFGNLTSANSIIGKIDYFGDS